MGITCLFGTCHVTAYFVSWSQYVKSHFIPSYSALCMSTRSTCPRLPKPSVMIGLCPALPFLMLFLIFMHVAHSAQYKEHMTREMLKYFRATFLCITRSFPCPVAKRASRRIWNNSSFGAARAFLNSKLSKCSFFFGLFHPQARFPRNKLCSIYKHRFWLFPKTSWHIHYPDTIYDSIHYDITKGEWQEWRYFHGWQLTVCAVYNGGGLTGHARES